VSSLLTLPSWFCCAWQTNESRQKQSMYCVISLCYTLFLFEGFKELFFLFSVNRVEMSVTLSLFSHWSWKVLTELRETWDRSMFGATFWHPRKVLTSTLVVSRPWCAVKHRLVPMLLRHEATLNSGITGHVKHYSKKLQFSLFSCMHRPLATYEQFVCDLQYYIHKWKLMLVAFFQYSISFQVPSAREVVEVGKD